MEQLRSVATVMGAAARPNTSKRMLGFEAILRAMGQDVGRPTLATGQGDLLGMFIDEIKTYRLDSKDPFHHRLAMSPARPRKMK